jgi:hypothetical protein
VVYHVLTADSVEEYSEALKVFRTKRRETWLKDASPIWQAARTTSWIAIRWRTSPTISSTNLPYSRATCSTPSASSWMGRGWKWGSFESFTWTTRRCLNPLDPNRASAVSLLAPATQADGGEEGAGRAAAPSGVSVGKKGKTVCLCDSRPLLPLYFCRFFFVLIAVLHIGCADSANSQLSQRLTKTRKILIDYRIRSHEKQLLIEDPSEVNNIVASLSIKNVDRSQILKYHAFLRVTFIGSDDAVLPLGFFQPTVLHRTAWGQIILSNTAFYDHIVDVVSRAEGEPIDFFPPDR